MIVTDRGQVFHVYIVDYDAVPVVRSLQDTASFLSWWRDQARLYNAPVPQYDGADRGIAARLLRRHGLDRIKAVGVWFWRRHADALIDGSYRRHMILFQAKFSDAERDLRETETTGVSG